MFKNNRVVYTAADATFTGDCVSETKTHLSIDLGEGNGIACMPIADGKIEIVGPAGKRRRVKRVAVQQTAAPVVAKPKAKRTKSGVSKKDRALEIYRETIHFGKEGVIGAFMEQLDMSKAGATTYFYNCKKVA